MTVEDLGIGQVYEVVEEFDCGFNILKHPGLKSVITANTRLKVGTLMKYVSHDRTDTLMPYGFHFIIDGKIIINNRNTSGIFWFSEAELS